MGSSILFSLGMFPKTYDQVKPSSYFLIQFQVDGKLACPKMCHNSVRYWKIYLITDAIQSNTTSSNDNVQESCCFARSPSATT